MFRVTAAFACFVSAAAMAGDDERKIQEESVID